MAASKKPAAPTRIYELEIELAHIKPRIWRRILVPDTMTLATLDRVVQEAFGWENCHLHEFTIGDEQYGMVEMEQEFGMGLNFGRTLQDERQFTVGQALGEHIERFVYEYDFGDGWVHIVKVRTTHQPDQGNRTPQCIAGKNACPPEDIGGPPGYDHFLKVLADPKHEEHDVLLEWVGEEFDPKEFDLDRTNARIKRLK